MPSPQPRIKGSEIPRPASQTTQRSQSTRTSQGSVASHSDPWRQQHRGFTPSESSASEPSRNLSVHSPATWRGPQDMATGLPVPTSSPHPPVDQPQRTYSTPNIQDRSQWPGTTPNYGYMVDPNQPTTSYPPGGKSMQYPGQPQAPPYQALPPGLSAPPSAHPGYQRPSLATPHAEFQGLTMHSPAENPAQPPSGMHEQQHVSHPTYNVPPGQMTPASEYHGTPQHSAMHREHLGSSPYNATPTSTPYQPSVLPHTQHMHMEYHGAPGQQQYQYGPYHNNG